MHIAYEDEELFFPFILVVLFVLLFIVFRLVLHFPFGFAGFILIVMGFYFSYLLQINRIGMFHSMCIYYIIYINRIK